LWGWPPARVTAAGQCNETHLWVWPWPALSCGEKRSLSDACSCTSDKEKGGSNGIWLLSSDKGNEVVRHMEGEPHRKNTALRSVWCGPCMQEQAPSS
jgi:hypothetical protein